MSISKADRTPGFCPSCGSILPHLMASGNVTCCSCKASFTPDVYGDMKTEYTIHFNTYHPEKENHSAQDNNDEEGPTVERTCSKCGHDKMSYATLQLRSADEGQTVFFTCIKCKHKETENS